MEGMVLLKVLVIVVLSSWISNPCEAAEEGGKELTDPQCEELGFVREKLNCDTCDMFLSIEHDLFDDCQACCIVQDKKAPKKYKSAVIYVDEWLVKARYPMISNFLEEKMSRFGSSVKLKPSRGNTPYIKLRTAEKKTSEKISIDSWKTEDIEEFLEQKLKL